MSEIVFAVGAGQDWYTHAVVAALRHELDAQGVPTSHSHGRIPALAPGAGCVAVPLPGGGGLAGLEDATVRARCVLVLPEGSAGADPAAIAELTLSSARSFGLDPALVPRGAWRAAGIEPLSLGHTDAWRVPRDDAPERSVDMLFAASATSRRIREVAGMARALSRLGCDVHFLDDLTLGDGGTPVFPDGTSLVRRLATAKVVLALNAEERRSFSWAHATMAFHAGAVLVAEHAPGHEPLEPGVHLALGEARSLPHLAEAILGDSARLTGMRRNASDMLEAGGSMAASAARLAEAALGAGAGALTATPAGTPASTAADPVPVVSAPMESLGAAAREIRLDLIEMRRRITRLEQTVAAGAPPPRIHERARTSAYAVAVPRISVITALYDHAVHIEAALDSVARSLERSFELVVVDDGSTDGSGDIVERWMAAHERLPVLLLEHPVNRGLPQARNAGLDWARGEYCFILDSDNCIRPECLGLLMDSLDSDPGAMFAYGMLEVYGELEPYFAAGGDQLINRLAWDPAKLRSGNFVDAMAMLRRAALLELDGYTTDRRLYGWEDYDLWCGMAERGYRGVRVPRIVARYHTTPTSMLALSNLSKVAARAALAERHPRLMQV